MRIKTALLASTAFAVAAMCPQAQARDFYVSVLGGANWTDDASQFVDDLADDSTLFSTHLDSDTGYMVGIVVGTSLDRWLTGLRAELEMSYRRNHHNLDGFFTDTDVDETSNIIAEGHTSSFAVMANVWYDIDIGSKVRPYIGGGAGWARSTADFAGRLETTNSNTYDTSDTDEEAAFAWQLGIGVNYEVMPDVDVGLGYRYFNGPGMRLYTDLGDGSNDGVDLDNENHTVAATLTIHMRP